ncbi:MAG TPA: hypothetical protein VKA63_11935 [Candidatus Krumholzibacteria bacterium]|nr:hypothetical protein [Candidatus Krumholzibacteria bacterium]
MRRTLLFLLPILLLLSSSGALSSCGHRSQNNERETGHPILLVHADRAGSDELRNDRLWRELIDSTLGGCDLMGTARFAASPAQKTLNDRILVVLTHAAMAELDTLSLGKLGAFVEQGGIAMLDTPEGPWAKTAGLRILFSKEHDQLSWPAQLGWETGSSISSAFDANAPGQKAMPASLPPLSIHFVQSGLRPVSYGLRSVGNPFGMSSIWWTSRGQGGYLSQALCLPRLLRALEKSSTLGEQREAQWRTAIIDALLSPDIFPLPFPRLWPQPCDRSLSSLSQPEWRQFRREIHFLPSWQAPRTLQLKLEVPGEDFRAAIALPRRWRDRTLSDWNSSFPRPKSQRVEAGGREWRLVCLPPGESTLTLSYRPTHR